MHVTCPNCRARYQVPEILFSRARSLHCDLCSHVWPRDDAAEPPPAPLVQHPPASDTDDLPIVKPLVAPIPVRDGWTAGDWARAPAMGLFAQTRFWLAAWGVSGITLVAAACVLWRCRADLIHVWPATARLFG